MPGVSKSTPPQAMPALAAPGQTQTQSPPVVARTPVVVSETLVVEPSLTVPSLRPVAAQLRSDDQMRMAHTADGFVDAVVGFGAINSSPPTRVSIPPGAVIIRHMGNNGSTWMKRKRGQPSIVGLFTRYSSGPGSISSSSGASSSSSTGSSGVATAGG